MWYLLLPLFMLHRLHLLHLCTLLLPSVTSVILGSEDSANLVCVDAISPQLSPTAGRKRFRRQSTAYDECVNQKISPVRRGSRPFLRQEGVEPVPLFFKVTISVNSSDPPCKDDGEISVNISQISFEFVFIQSWYRRLSQKWKAGFIIPRLCCRGQYKEGKERF